MRYLFLVLLVSCAHSQKLEMPATAAAIVHVKASEEDLKSFKDELVEAGPPGEGSRHQRPPPPVVASAPSKERVERKELFSLPLQAIGAGGHPHPTSVTIACSPCPSCPGCPACPACPACPGPPPKDPEKPWWHDMAKILAAAAGGAFAMKLTKLFGLTS